MLEIVDDRHGRGSTIVTSQLPVEHWHEAIADAILDRLVHNAHRLTLKGDSLDSDEFLLNSRRSRAEASVAALQGVK